MFTKSQVACPLEPRGVRDRDDSTPTIPIGREQQECAFEAPPIHAVQIETGTRDGVFAFETAAASLIRALRRCWGVVTARADRDKTPPPKTGGVRASTTGISNLSRGGTVAGRFRIVRFIDRGGMGEVYEVEDLALRSRPHLALKIIREEIVSHPAALAHFEREVEISKRITHPNVCRTFDLGIDQRLDAAGRPLTVLFLTMELLQGETLAARLGGRGHMSMAEALPIIRQLAAAIDAVHAMGIVHADLKPSNVMLVPGPDGAVRAVLTDFGLAAPCPSDGNCYCDASPGLMGGTPDFMSPEQVLRGAVRTSSDIYSLGLIIYRMLTGALPFDGGSSTARMTQRLHEYPLSPRHYVPELVPHWERAILKCLAKDPAQRFSRAYDVIAAMITADPPPE